MTTRVTNPLATPASEMAATMQSTPPTSHAPVFSAPPTPDPTRLTGKKDPLILSIIIAANGKDYGQLSDGRWGIVTCATHKPSPVIIWHPATVQILEAV